MPEPLRGSGAETGTRLLSESEFLGIMLLFRSVFFLHRAYDFGTAGRLRILFSERGSGAEPERRTKLLSESEVLGTVLLFYLYRSTALLHRAD